MTRIRLLLVCLLAAVLVISLPEQKWELTRGECCAGEGLPSLPPAPAPQHWTGRMTAVEQAGGGGTGRVLSSAPAVSLGGRRSRAPQLMKAPAQLRGWEHSIGDATVVTGGDTTVVTGLAMADTRAHVMLVSPSVKDETVVCRGDALLNCGFASPKKGDLPLSLRRSGAGIALTISNTDIFIEPGGVRFSRSVSF